MKSKKIKAIILLGALLASLTSFGFSKKSPKTKNENVKKIVKKADNLNQNKNITKNININEDKNKNSQNLSERPKLSISKEELNRVAKRIFQNEAAGKKNDLVVWNSGENFPSLGIGHFIWYKKNEKGKFEESFPPLVEFYKSKNIELPKIIKDNKFAPWKSREEFLKLKQNNNPEITELINFLYNTQDTQIEFIFNRLEDSLEKMLKVAKNKENVKKQFYRVANSPNGLYPLIDYVNFKGEGISPSETYNGQGWGLLQVLENMKGSQTGKSALEEFSQSAKSVLERRVKNSGAKNEQRWLRGWLNRCETYNN
jgi:hypothetical protein cdivTM_05665